MNVFSRLQQKQNPAVAVFNHSHQSAALSALLALAVLLPAGARAQEPVFESRVSLVRVDVEVTDAHHRALTGLTRSDFRVFDDERPQAITEFSFEREPLDLILSFDSSRRMRSKLLSVIRAVELGFHELRPGDRVCVMSYSTGPIELAPFTADLDEANQTIALRIPQLRFSGDSNPATAADAAARRFQNEPNSGRRRAVLIVTDQPVASEPGIGNSVRNLWRTNTVASELIISAGAAPSNKTNPLVTESGGSVTVTGSDPGEAFQEALRRLRSRYTLYYSMPSGSPGSRHAIRIEVAIPGARVAARTGCIVPEN